MKVLQINTVSGFGSTGKIVLDLSKELKKQNHLSYVAFGQKKSIWPSSFKVGTLFENYIHNAFSRLFDSQGHYSKKGTQKLIKFIIKINPDIVHLHNIHGNYLNYTSLFNFLSKTEIPVIWTFHDCWPFTGHCAYFDLVNCNKWVSGCYNCPSSKSYPPSILIDNSKNNYLNKKKVFNKLNNLTIVTPSNWLSSLVQKSFLKNYKVNVINNGIDTKVFKITDVTKLKKELVIGNKTVLLGVSSEGFEKRKGLKYFVELSKSLDASKFALILIGVSKRDIKELPENVIKISRTSNIEELVNYYNLADLFLNLTLEDNFPTTNLEALACGTPIITFDTGGSPEVIDNKTGLIIERGNIQHLKREISNLNKEFKIKNSAYCRNKAKEFYNVETMYKKYIELYKQKL